MTLNTVPSISDLNAEVDRCLRAPIGVEEANKKIRDVFLHFIMLINVLVNSLKSNNVTVPSFVYPPMPQINPRSSTESMSVCSDSDDSSTTTQSKKKSQKPISELIAELTQSVKRRIITHTDVDFGKCANLDTYDSKIRDCYKKIDNLHTINCMSMLFWGKHCFF